MTDITPKDQTRDKLVEAAAAIFHERGYAASGVADILKSAGAGSGSLYHFFESKEDLVIAVLDRYKERLPRAIFGPVKERIADPVERIFGVLRFYREYLRANGCTRGCPVANLACELSDTNALVRAKVDELFACWRGAIRECVDDALDRMPPGVDPEAVATFVLAVMEGGVMQARASRSLAPFESCIGQLRVYFDSLSSRGSHLANSRGETGLSGRPQEQQGACAEEAPLRSPEDE